MDDDFKIIFYFKLLIFFPPKWSDESVALCLSVSRVLEHFSISSDLKFK